MMIRFGFFVAVSVAVYTATRLTRNSSQSSLINSSGEESFKHSDDEERDSYKLKGSKYVGEKEEEEEVLIITNSMLFSDLSKGTDIHLPNSMYQVKSDSPSKQDNSKAVTCTKNEETDLVCLRNLVHELGNTQETLKTKLLVYYGMKEQEMEIVELKKHLNLKMVEIGKLCLTIKTLKVDNQKLQEEVIQCLSVKKQLERARIQIRELQKKIQIVGQPRMEQVIMLKEQVEAFQADEDHKNDAEIQKKLNAGNDLELEVMELKRRHKELQLEKRTFALKLVLAEARITAFSNMTEIEEIERIRIEADALMLANNVLSTKVDKLHTDRFNVVEELVYQRWVNSCLRHELHISQTPLRMSSTSDTECISPPQSSIERKKLYGNLEDIPRSENIRTGQKTSLIHKLKRWRSSMDNSSVVSSLNRSSGSSSRWTTSSESSRSRRSSISTGSYEASTLKNEGDRVAVTTVEKKGSGSIETEKCPHRKRRVSFNDTLSTIAAPSERISTSVSILDDMPLAKKDRGKIVEMQKPYKEKADELRTDIFADGSNLISRLKISGAKLQREEPLTLPLVSTSSEKTIDKHKVITQVVSEITLADHIEESARGMPKSVDIHDVQPERSQFDAILVFFLVLILLYFSLHSVFRWCSTFIHHA